MEVCSCCRDNLFPDNTNMLSCCLNLVCNSCRADIIMFGCPDCVKSESDQVGSYITKLIKSYNVGQLLTKCEKGMTELKALSDLVGAFTNFSKSTPHDISNQYAKLNQTFTKTVNLLQDDVESYHDRLTRIKTYIDIILTQPNHFKLTDVVKILTRMDHDLTWNLPYVAPPVIINNKVGFLLEHPVVTTISSCPHKLIQLISVKNTLYSLVKYNDRYELYYLNDYANQNLWLPLILVPFNDQVYIKELVSLDTMFAIITFNQAWLYDNSLLLIKKLNYQNIIKLLFQLKQNLIIIITGSNIKRKYNLVCLNLATDDIMWQQVITASSSKPRFELVGDKFTYEGCAFDISTGSEVDIDQSASFYLPRLDIQPYHTTVTIGPFELRCGHSKSWTHDVAKGFISEDELILYQDKGREIRRYHLLQ